MLKEFGHHRPCASLHIFTWHAKNIRSWPLCLHYFSGLCVQTATLRNKVISFSRTKSLFIAFYKRGGSPILLLLWCNTNPLVCRAPAGLLHTAPMGLGSGGKRNWCKHDAFATCFALSNKVLCLWSRNVMSSASIHETVTGKPISLKVGQNQIPNTYMPWGERK